MLLNCYKVNYQLPYMEFAVLWSSAKSFMLTWLAYVRMNFIFSLKNSSGEICVEERTQKFLLQLPERQTNEPKAKNKLSDFDERFIH